MKLRRCRPSKQQTFPARLSLTALRRPTGMFSSLRSGAEFLSPPAGLSGSDPLQTDLLERAVTQSFLRVCEISRTSSAEGWSCALFKGSAADIRGFIPLSDQQNKGNFHASGGFGAPEATLGSPEQMI